MPPRRCCLPEALLLSNCWPSHSGCRRCRTWRCACFPLLDQARSVVPHCGKSRKLWCRGQWRPQTCRWLFLGCCGCRSPGCRGHPPGIPVFGFHVGAHAGAGVSHANGDDLFLRRAGSGERSCRPSCAPPRPARSGHPDPTMRAVRRHRIHAGSGH